MWSPTLLVLLASVTACLSALVKAPSGNFELLILHNNDMHARFEQTSQLSGACSTEDRELGKCYGGFPRVAHVVKEARKAAQSGNGPPVLYLNAGDTYTGTAWFTIYKWEIAAEFINALQPDAISLGNHEFDEAVAGLIPFIRNVSTPVLAANLILDKEPELQEEENLYKSIVLKKNGVKIGIIGYLTADTKFLAPKNNVEYEDEIPVLQREVKKLKNQGVNILIALGHSGYYKDLQIAKNVEELDLVIGGHSNTFLWNKNTTDEKPEKPTDLYPKEVIQASGRIVRVVQAYAYTKYLGKLHLTFDRNGEIIECDGLPILLNQKVPKDPELLSMVEKYRKSINKINSVVVGSSTEALHGAYCRLRECNIGDLIADAMLSHTQSMGNNGIKIAVVQGGRIRSSIDRPLKPFEMTREDWFTVLPFTDSLTAVTMNGTILRKSLEHSVEGWQITDSPGQFLQFAGMQVTYDLAQPPGSRVVTAKAACSTCIDNELANIEDQMEYKVIMCTFLADGGDGFSMFEGLPKEIFSFNEMGSVIYYLNETGMISQKEDGRLVLLNEDVAIKQAKNKMNSVIGSKGQHYLPDNVLHCLGLLLALIIQF